MALMDRSAFFREYEKPGNIDAIEVRRLKDGFVLRTYIGNDKGPEIITTLQELRELRDLLTENIEAFENR